MPNRNQVYFVSSEQIPESTASGAPEEQSIVTLVSRQTKGDIHSAESRRAKITRQALSIMPPTLENEQRSNDIAAGMIVTVLGGWLGSRMLKSRAFTAATYILLLFIGAGLAGLFLGAVLGQGFIPVEPFQIALFTIAGIAVFVLGVGLSLMLSSKKEVAQPSLEPAPLQEILIPMQEVDPGAVVQVQEPSHGVLIPVQLSPRVLIPVKELNPRPRAGRRKTD